MERDRTLEEDVVSNTLSFPVVAALLATVLTAVLTSELATEVSYLFILFLL